MYNNTISDGLSDYYNFTNSSTAAYYSSYPNCTDSLSYNDKYNSIVWVWIRFRFRVEFRIIVRIRLVFASTKFRSSNLARVAAK